MGEHLPSAPVNDEARKHNGNLPGMGGVFNLVNLHVYHYGGNNPLKYVDPDGRNNKPIVKPFVNRDHSAGKPLKEHMPRAPKPIVDRAGLLSSRVEQTKPGQCLAMSYMGVAQTYAQSQGVDRNLTQSEVNKLLDDPVIWDGDRAGAAPYTIEQTLKTLGVDTSNLKIEREDGIVSTAFATIRHVADSSGSAGHFNEGTASGSFYWDPWDGADDKGREVFKYMSIVIKEVGE